MKFVGCAVEIASIAINFSPEALKAHTFFPKLSAIPQAFAGQRGELAAGDSLHPD